MSMQGIPFGEDIMTLFMGLDKPTEPGQHGRTVVPAPNKDAIALVSQIKDLCEEFLLNCKECDDDEKKPSDKPDKDSSIMEVKKTVSKTDATDDQDEQNKEE